WEIGNVAASDASDTLRIELRRGRPYNVTQVVLSACLGVTVNFATFGLGDSTFVRNSGNFAHAFIGEGGRITTAFARVMNYSARGMDINDSHAFQAGNPGTAPSGGPAPNSHGRVVFAARPNGNIDVFDTFFYGIVGSVPVRDPIIGPLRVGRDTGGNQLLFGITARGLVMVRLPPIVNLFPIRSSP